MCKVGDEEAVVVRLLALNANAGAALSHAVVVGAVNTQADSMGAWVH